MFEATFKEGLKYVFIFASRIRKWGPSVHDSSELQLNRTHKCVLSFFCNTVQQAALSIGYWGDWELWYLHSLLSSAVVILPNSKQDIWFLLPREEEIWKIYLYLPMKQLAWFH